MYICTENKVFLQKGRGGPLHTSVIVGAWPGYLPCWGLARERARLRQAPWRHQGGWGVMRSRGRCLGSALLCGTPDENDPGNELQKREYRFREGLGRRLQTRDPPHTHATPLHSLYPFVPLGPGIAKPHSALGADDVQMNDGHITCPQVTALQLGRVARHSLNSLFP